MSQNYIQPGLAMTYVAPVGGVVSGTGYLIGALFVVAATTRAAGLDFVGDTNGVFELPKTTGAAWTAGQLMYWDDTAKKVTGTVGANKLIGSAARIELSAAAVGWVRLNGTAH